MEKDKISKEISKHNHQTLPSKERFRDLLLKLEKEYDLLWEENQELKIKCGMMPPPIISTSTINITNNKTSSTGAVSTISSSIPPSKQLNDLNSSGNKVVLNSSTNNERVSSSSGGSKLSKIKKVSSSMKSSTGMNASSNNSGNSGKHMKDSSSKRDGSHKWVRAREFIGHRDGIWEITSCPWDILSFATASTDRTARIWTVDGSKLPYVYTAHTGTVNSIRYHPMERFLCTASGDKTIHIFKLPNDRNSQNGGIRSPLPSSLIQNIFQQPNTNATNIPNSSYNLPTIPPVSISSGSGLSPNLQQPNNQNQSPQQSHSPLQSRNEKTKNKLWTPLLERQQQQQQQQQQMNQQQTHFEDDSIDNDNDNYIPPHSPTSFIGDENEFQQQQQQQQPVQYQHNQQQTQPSQQHNENNYIIIRSPSLELKGHSGPVISSCWLSSSVIVSGSWDNTIRYWNTDTGRSITQNNICSDSKSYRITNLSNCPNNNNSSVTSSTDGIVRLWDFRSSNNGGTSSCVDSIQGFQDSANTAIFTYDGNNIIAGGEDRTVRVWDIRQTKNYKTSIRCPFSINRLSVSPSTNIIAIPQDDGRISVYDIYGHRQGKLRDQYKYGHKSLASATAWSLDDSVIYSCGFDRKVIAWIDQDNTSKKN